MKKSVSMLAGLALMAGGSAATAGVIPLVNVDLSLNYWNAQPSGDIRSGGDRLDIEDDLNFGRDGQLGWQARVTHPVPLIPNFRIRYTDYDETEDGQANTNFQGQSFGSDVRTTLDLSHYDYTIFYTAPLPVVGLDLGLNVKHFVGEVIMEDRTVPGRQESVNLKEMVPMLYAHARVDLPLTGLGAGAEINYISFDGDTVSDMELYLGYSYQLVYGQVGYRDFSVDIEGSGNLEVDADITGPFARVGVRF